MVCRRLLRNVGVQCGDVGLVLARNALDRAHPSRKRRHVGLRTRDVSLVGLRERERPVRRILCTRNLSTVRLHGGFQRRDVLLVLAHLRLHREDVRVRVGNVVRRLFHLRINLAHRGVVLVAQVRLVRRCVQIQIIVRCVLCSHYTLSSSYMIPSGTKPSPIS